MKSYKTVPVEGSPSSFVENAVSEIQDLANEVDEWKSGLESTNLSTSEKYQMLETAYDELSSVDNTIEEFPHDETKLTCYVSVPKRKKRSPSRSARLENANAKLAAVKEFYENLDGDYSEIVEALEDMIKEVEFPRMYG